MNLFQFGNFEAEFDPTDAAFVQLYETAAARYAEQIEKIDKKQTVSAQIKAMCAVFFDAFDTLFGEGTHEKMFGETKSVELCAKAFHQLVETMRNYQIPFAKRSPVPKAKGGKRAIK